MDQVKAVLGMMKKHGFWILIGMVVLLGVGVWFTAARALAARYEARKGELETQYTTVNGIKSESTGETASHPNEGTIAKWLTRVGNNRKEALLAWTRMYEDQKQRNQWPRTLSDRFHAMIKTVEARGAVTDQEVQIPNEFLEEYQVFIKQHFPDMDKIIDRLKPKVVKGARGAVMGGAMGTAMGTAGPGAMYGGETGYMSGGYPGGGDGYGEGSYDMGAGGYGLGGSGGMGMAGAEMEGIVEWKDADYARIQAGVYWVDRPLTIEVRLAQEDLWVYEALLRSIALTNKDAGATSYYNAAIKRIEALEIGQPAAMAMRSAKSRLGLNTLLASGGGMGSGYDSEMMGGSSGMMGSGSEMMGSSEMMMGSSEMMMGSGGEYGEGGAMMGVSARTPEQVAKRLLTGRYVDLTGEPQAADSEPYAEFKLMPVHIIVIMDQQKLPDFLVNLANCEMPVDVKQVSIQASGKMAFSSGGMEGGYGGEGGMGGYGGGMGGYGGGMGGNMMGGSMGGYGGSSSMGGYGGSGMMGDSESSMGGYGEMMGSGGEGYGGGMGGGISTAGDEAKQDVPIEILGVIRIFNPPDMAKLGTGSATDESSEGPVAATPPRDAPTMAPPMPGPGGPPIAPGGPAPAMGSPTPATGPPAPGPSGPPGPGNG